jgi:hypothetical protein
MSGNQSSERVNELRTDIDSNELPEWARLAGDRGRWTRRRAMPLADMVRCTLAKQGLTTVMELRRSARQRGTTESAINKQVYLRQRQKLNPDVFIYLNRKYLRRLYHGDEPELWRGYVV